MPSPLLLATRSTFEALALLFAAPQPAPESDAVGALGAGAVGMRVAFATPAGAACGALHVAVSAGVADALAENMLGVAPSGDPEQVAGSRRDAVGELANVITGNVLPEAVGRGAVFHLAAPTLVPPEGVVAACADAAQAVALDAASPAWQEWFDVEGGWAAVSLVLDPQAFGESAGEPLGAGSARAA